ncbi:PRD domain-containing protein [Weissella soli]|uniref:PRD domain-containing protein n=3 Tax=Weissella soli TaxID=155866 RepID=UPI001F21B1AE|nr:PRD domain-containing protein [Weissella soli]GJM48116.1 transcriptional antiterminator [Weissella soli]
MLVKKIFNNNVLPAEEASQELIVIGRGVGFQQKIGGQIDVSKIEKSYYPQDDQWIKLFNELTDSISSEYIEIASYIITMAEEHLATTFDDYLLIGLADHIQYAVTRWQSKLPIKNELLWETQHFYPEEYHIGELAVDYIATRLNIKLPVDEVGFIALKFVEKRNGPQENERATQMIQLIEGILTIIRYELLPNIDESELNYQRLIVHLRFFVDRLLGNHVEDEVENSFDRVMAEHMAQRYVAAFTCAQHVITYVAKQTQRQVNDNEKIYLTMHLQRILDH